MNIELVFQETTNEHIHWRNHAELYASDAKQIEAIGTALRHWNIPFRKWSSVSDFIEHRKTKPREDILVFSIIENCFERNRPCLIPSIWELMGIPYIGSDPYALMITSDKKLFQDICQKGGWLCPRYIQITGSNTPDEIRSALTEERISFPVVIKYRYGSMSYGTYKINDFDALITAATNLLAKEPESPILCEEYISGYEITVPVVGTGVNARVLNVIQYTDSQKQPLNLYDYQWKTEYDPLVQLHVYKGNPALTNRIEQECLRLHRFLGIRDMSRFDLRVTETGAVYWLEANCIPSLGYDGAFDPKSYGHKETFDDVILEIVQSGKERYWS